MVQFRLPLPPKHLNRDATPKPHQPQWTLLNRDIRHVPPFSDNYCSNTKFTVANVSSSLKTHNAEIDL